MHLADMCPLDLLKTVLKISGSEETSYARAWALCSEVMEMADEGLGLVGGSNHTTPVQPLIWPLPPQPFSES